MQDKPIITAPNLEPLDQALAAKAKILRDAPVFVSSTDSNPLDEKQLIFLVLAGLKPVSQVASSHWVNVPGGRETMADDPRQVAAFLDSLGLAYALSSFGIHATQALVALRPALLAEFERASAVNDTARCGELFGFPKTAVEAFVRGEVLSDDRYDVILAEAGITDSYFHFSAKHYADEARVVRRWLDTLARYGLMDG